MFQSMVKVEADPELGLIDQSTHTHTHTKAKKKEREKTQSWLNTVRRLTRSSRKTVWWFDANIFKRIKLVGDGERAAHDSWEIPKSPAKLPYNQTKYIKIKNRKKDWWMFLRRNSAPARKPRRDGKSAETAPL